MNIIIAFLLVAMGMAIDAGYQHRLRVAEVNSYEVGYQQGLKEGDLRRISYVPDLVVKKEDPSMAAPVAMPPTFEERMRKHGQATVRIK